MPPWQWATGGGLSLSGNGAVATPHAPLFVKRFLRIVSPRTPARTMPVPTGVNAAVPAPGTLGLLLSWNELPSMNVHERDVLVGHQPSAGDGASPLFWLLEIRPVLLWSHSESTIRRWPPEFVPE